MRIGCLQFAPQVGDIDNNLNRADAVLQRADLDSLDLLVLPELAFTGYNFKSLQQITPFLEPSGSGISSLWARTVALKYDCTVVLGYPEKVDVSSKWPTGPEFYNSAIVVNGEGETIANYRKAFLHHIDETWALEGPEGFFEKYIPGLGYTSIGICMDINPRKFEAPWDDFEFATHVLQVQSNLVIVSMAWITREEYRHFSRKPDEPDMETLAYWVSRLEPIIRAEPKEEIIVVLCNRTGREDNATYAGTSAVIGIHDGEVNVYGLLGRSAKELLVVNTDDPPYAKLAHRPIASSDGLSGSLIDDSGSNHAGMSEPRAKATNLSTSDATTLLEAEADSSRLELASSATPLVTGSTVILPLPHHEATRNRCLCVQTREHDESYVKQVEPSVRPSASTLPSNPRKQNPRPPEDSTPYPHDDDVLARHAAWWDRLPSTASQSRIDEGTDMDKDSRGDPGNPNQDWQSGQEMTAPARPASPKSRHASRSGSQVRSASAPRTSNIATTSSQGYQQAITLAPLAQDQRMLLSGQTTPQPNIADTLLQTATNRGRQPGKPSETHAPKGGGRGHERSTSADSTRNDILHRRDRRRHQFTDAPRRSSSQPK